MRRKLWCICSGDTGESFGLSVGTDDTKTFQKGAGIISGLDLVCGKEHLMVTGREAHLWCPERQKTEG